MREDSALTSCPRSWLSGFAFVERLDPFTPMDGRGISLHRGLSVVWGNGETRGAEELLTGQSVGKTLVCRLVCYGLGEKEYLRDRLEGATRHFEPREQELRKDRGWLVWPMEDFTELVFAVGDAVDREKEEARDLVGRDLEGVEV